jgi:hypothetical protein
MSSVTASVGSAISVNTTTSKTGSDSASTSDGETIQQSPKPAENQTLGERLAESATTEDILKNIPTPLNPNNAPVYGMVQGSKEIAQMAIDRVSFETFPTVKPNTGWTFGDDGIVPSEQTLGPNNKTLQSLASSAGLENIKNDNGILSVDISNLPELGAASLLNFDVANLTGQILDKVKADPTMKRMEEQVIYSVQQDARYGKETFYVTGSTVVGFGGKRWRSNDEAWGSISDKNPLFHKETLEVGANELTWSLRNATVKYWAEVAPSGNIKIEYRLNDRLDLSGSKGRSEAYNNISNAMGFLYHDLGGGNINLQTRAQWSTTVD